MVINGYWKGSKFTFSLKPNSLTVSLDQGKWTNVFSFDNTGRLWTAMVEGISYRRGLDGKVVARWITGSTSHERRWLTSPEADALVSRSQLLASALLMSIRNNCVDFQPAISIPPALEPALQAAAAFSPEISCEDAAAFNNIYKPIGILPPDQYLAVVLQLTEGCSYNGCTFCSFYRDRPFRIKSPAEFSAHIQSVKGYLGAGLSLRRTIFMGDANAIVVPVERLIPLLEITNEHLPVEALGGIYAFLDGFSAHKKTPEDYQRLAHLGLKRVYIGLESGNAALLRFLKKPGQPEEILRAVKTIKAGGISVGIIVLLGAGGHQYAKAHVADSVKIINAMSLDMDDLLYFSELVESENIPYVQDAFRANLLPLSASERLEQALQIEAGLRFSPTRGTPHISRYDIREFVY